jgi:4-hydroxy-4-methyl-2-oxoglutarate aldolase
LSSSGAEFSGLIERYRKVETAAISDAMEPRLSAMDAEIKSVMGKVHVAGPALTVRCYPGDELAFEKAIEMAEKGDIIVIDARGVTQAALGGGIMFGKLWLKGAEAVIIDGATRDVEEIMDYGFPVFARAVTPTSAVGASMGEINVPIQCGGVPVHPGDIIVGDTDGVVVVPRDEAEAVLIIAEKIASMDDQTVRWIKQKISMAEIDESRAPMTKEIIELKEKLLGRRLETHW